MNQPPPWCGLTDCDMHSHNITLDHQQQKAMLNTNKSLREENKQLRQTAGAANNRAEAAQRELYGVIAERDALAQHLAEERARNREFAHHLAIAEFGTPA